MSRRLSFSLLAIILFVLARPGLGRAQASGWEEIAPGIEYQEFFVSGPNHVFVARMDQTHPSVTIESSLGLGRLADGLETVSGMASRYDGAINYWDQDWGATNQVVVAINGSDFDYTEERPFSGMVQSGWYTKRFDDCGGGSGFAWTLDRDAFIGENIIHRSWKQIVTHLPTGETIRIDGINQRRRRDELILYTPQFDTNTRTKAKTNSVEILVELERPALILPVDPLDPLKKVFGVVRAIEVEIGSMAIPFDHLVISARGDPASVLLDDIGFQVGDRVGINQEITNAASDCVTSVPGSWTKTYASISGVTVILRDGEIPDFGDNPNETLRAPRTVVALNNDYVFFVVVDGRHPGVSVGMNYVELAAFLRDTLGATWAINQDGGGSSTMWVNGQVKNNTLCNNNCVSGSPTKSPAGPVYRLGDEDHNVFLPIANRPSKTQRAVANGLMMVVVHPKAISPTGYQPDDPIVTTASGAIRLGPGWNYPHLRTFEGGEEGNVVPHEAGLNGVFATRTYWWKVSLGGVTGWVPETTFTHAGWLQIPIIKRITELFTFQNPVE